jgi:hypothetical protein
LRVIVRTRMRKRKRKRKHIYDFMGYFETEPIVFFSERKGVFGFRRRAFWPGRL